MKLRGLRAGTVACQLNDLLAPAFDYLIEGIAGTDGGRLNSGDDRLAYVQPGLGAIFDVERIILTEILAGQRPGIAAVIFTFDLPETDAVLPCRQSSGLPAGLYRDRAVCTISLEPANRFRQENRAVSRIRRGCKLYPFALGAIRIVCCARRPGNQYREYYKNTDPHSNRSTLIICHSYTSIYNNFISRLYMVLYNTYTNQRYHRPT